MKAQIKKRLKRLLHKLGYELLPCPTYSINTLEIASVRYFSDMFKDLPPGDVVECGVGYGRSLVYLKYLALLGKRKVHGFDSFEGFPEPSAEDASERNASKGDVWAKATAEKVLRTIRNANLPTSGIELHKGYFETTLPSYEGEIALLHIDVDLYQSYKTVLEHLYPKVVSGGVVLFDEYGVEEWEWPGATKAINEMAKKHDWKIQKNEEIGKYFIRKP